MPRPFLLALMLASALTSATGDCSIRLVNGSNICSGRVEILYNHTWGTLCNDSWNMNATAVVCRQLGCGAPESAAFGQGSGSIRLNEVRCSGSEENITQCLHKRLGTYNCSHGEDAAVVCSGDLEMPNFSLISTHSAVSPGESVQFRCTTPKPRCNANAEFQLFMNGSSKSSQTHRSTVTFNLQNVDVSHQGAYSCRYSYQNGSINSSLSDTVNITVVHLQEPNISHSAPDGEFDVGLKGPVITRGHSFTIICSTQSQHPGGSFYLFRGSNIIRTQSAERLSTFFTFPEADYSHEGNYTCVYEVSVSSRTFRSSPSEPLLITITASLLPVIGAGVSALLLLLSVLIIALLLKRRQKRRNKEGNTCAGPSHDNGKEEADGDNDYENVELNENVEHDDSDEDYINVNSDHSGEDYEKVDTDDSGEDYVNVNIA